MKLKLNKKKLKLCLSEVSCMGHWLKKDGLGVDPAKLKVINDLPRSDSKKSSRTLFRVPTVSV